MTLVLHLARRIFGLIAIATLTGCGGGSSSNAPEQTDDTCVTASDCFTVIELWHGFSGNLREQFELQVTEFNSSQNNYEIKHVHKGSYAETLQAGIEAHKAGTGPTLLQVYEVATASIASEKISITIPELEQISGSHIDTDRYFPVIANFYSSSDNTLLAAPYNASSPVLFVNTKILTDAGLSTESSTRTWRDVEALLLSLRDQGQNCGMTSAWQSWIQLENLSAYHDRSFSTFGNGMDSLSSELTITTDFHVSHIDQLAEWIELGIFKYNGRGSRAVSSFLNEECALLTTSSANFRDVLLEGGFDFEVRPLPYYDINGAPNNTIIGGAALWALKDKTTAQYKAATEFINYITSNQQQVRWHEETGYLPLSESAYNEAIAQNVYVRQPNLEVAVKQMLGKEATTNSRGVRLGNFVEIRNIINTELEDVWSGEKTAIQALQDATENGNFLLREFEESISSDQ